MEGELTQAGDPRIDKYNQRIVEASQELLAKERREEGGGEGDIDDGGKRRKVSDGSRTMDQEHGSNMTDLVPGPTSSQDEWGSQHAKRPGNNEREELKRARVTGKYNKRRDQHDDDDARNKRLRGETWETWD